MSKSGNHRWLPRTCTEQRLGQQYKSFEFKGLHSTTSRQPMRSSAEVVQPCANTAHESGQNFMLL